jgi:hypothetical protein
MLIWNSGLLAKRSIVQAVNRNRLKQLNAVLFPAAAIAPSAIG